MSAPEGVSAMEGVCSRGVSAPGVCVCSQGVSALGEGVCSEGGVYPSMH